MLAGLPSSDADWASGFSFRGLRSDAGRSLVALLGFDSQHNEREKLEFGNVPNFDDLDLLHLIAARGSGCERRFLGSSPGTVFFQVLPLALECRAPVVVQMLANFWKRGGRRCGRLRLTLLKKRLFLGLHRKLCFC